LRKAKNTKNKFGKKSRKKLRKIEKVTEIVKHSKKNKPKAKKTMTQPQWITSVAFSVVLVTLLSGKSIFALIQESCRMQKSAPDEILVTHFILHRAATASACSMV
jgi:hypothetical protein